MWTARSCTRFAIEPGKRWIAGRSRNTGSRSAEASVAASIEPSRSFRSSGPENAFWTVICWSSTKPTSSAIGSVAMSWLASSESVKWSRSGMAAIVSPSAHHADGHEQAAARELGGAVVDLEILVAQGGQRPQVPQELSADPGGVARPLDAPDRDHVVDRAEVAVELGDGIGQEPRLDPLLHVLDQGVHREVLGVLGGARPRLHATLDAHGADTHRQVVVDVRVHPGQGELHRGDVAVAARLEERLPGVVGPAGGVDGAEVRTCELDVELRKESARVRALACGDAARDLEVEPVEPPDAVLDRQGAVELLHPREHVVDRHAGERIPRSEFADHERLLR